MKKHTLLRILLVIPLLVSAILVTSKFSMAEAQEGKICDIYPREGDVFRLADCNSFRFVSGWIATDKELIEEFQKGALVTVTVKSGSYSKTFSPEVVNTLWGDPIPIPAADLGLKCTTGPDVWVADYYLPLGSLEAGKYKTKLIIDPIYPLTDGFVDNCTWSNGDPITEVPALYRTKVTDVNRFEVTP